MDAVVPDSRFELDPLIAEAKRRMRLRRIVGIVGALVIAAAVTLALRPWDGAGGVATGADRPGIAQIPGMTRVNSSSVGDSVCAGMKGTYRPRWCSAIKLVRGRYESWILTSAYAQGHRFNVPEALARAHPGPVIVTDLWWKLASPQQAEQLVREPDFNHSYTGSPAPAVNGGVARSLDAFYFIAQRTPAREFQFYWAKGPVVVDVNVIGAELSVAQAQQIALLARPR
jgi:hypothetical protein